MNRKTKIIAASAACVVALSGVMGVGVSAAKQEKPVSSVSENTVQKTAETEKTEKNETVYVFAGADGSTDHVVASDWIREQGGDRYKNHSAEGELPVALHVSYKLDGQMIEPKDLAGKSGLLTIRYEFENRQTATVEENGQNKTVKVPFAAVTGAILDNDIFSQVQVNGGKLVNDGDRTMVLGLSFPGLKENLKVDNDKLDLPDHLEITARVQNFEMMNTITLVTNEVFRGVDTGKLDDFDELTDAADKMTDAMTQLMDGSVKLRDGLSVLKEKSGTLSDGVAQLSTGASQLNTGAGQLSSGLKQLSDNSAALNDGAEKVYETLLNQATAQINAQLKASGQSEIPALTKDNYAAVLDGLTGGVMEQIKAGVRAQILQEQIEPQRTQLTAAVTAKVKEAFVIKAVNANLPDAGIASLEQFEQMLTSSETPEPLKQALEQIDQGAGVYLAGEEGQKTIQDAVEDKITELLDTAMAGDQAAAVIQKLAGEKCGPIAAAKLGLDSYSAFYTGLTTYTAGVDTAKTGAVQLAEGAAALNGGVSTLSSNVPALLDGVNQLYDGSSKLADGLGEFNTEAVQKLADAVDGDLDSLISGLQSSLDAAAGYTGLDKEAGPDSCVKFVFRTDAIQ